MTPGIARIRLPWSALPGALVVLALGAAPALPQVRARVLDLPLYEPELGRVAIPAYHPRKLILELAADTPRPHAGGPVRPGVAPARLASSGLAALDAVNAAYAPTVYEPMFPEEHLLGPGRPGEDLTRFYVIELPAGASLEAALAAYAAVPGVVSAEPVPILPVSYVPNDPFVVNQWHLGQVSDRDSDVYEAWDVCQGDTSIVIAIVDTGVQYNHADLGGTAAPYTAGNIATNWIEMGGTPGVDDDANGFVDDFRGWDFVVNAVGQAGEDLITADNDPKDWVGHGTFCAGMASARTDNGTGIAGTAFKAKILGLRAGWAGPTGNGQLDMSWCAQAINYASNRGVHVINCSWESASTPSLVAAVTTAIARGVTITVAAGNEGTDSPPQNYLGTRGDCVDVGATRSDDVRASFSNWGSWVDVSAAGQAVYSTGSNQYTPTYESSSGTSFAAPFVAGAVGLYQAYRKSLGQPLATPAEVLMRLKDTGDNIDALNGGYAGYVGSRLNVHRLLTDPPTSWVNFGSSVFGTSPLVIDLDGDGDEEIVIGGSDQRLVAVTGADGDTLPGFPVLLTGGINSNAAAWDIDQDGLDEILVGTSQGRLYAVNGDGTIVPGFPVLLSGDLSAGPSVGDIDGSNPGLEVAIGSDNGNLWVLDRDGVVRPGWPQVARASIYAIPALHDFDGDGASEVVVGAFDSTMYAFHGDGSPLAGWPVAMPNRIWSSAAIGDIDRDGLADVVVGGYDNKVHALSGGGIPLAGWPVTLAGLVRSSPALADLVGGDGHLEVAVAGGQTVTVILNTGAFAPGWPQPLGGTVAGSVTVADVDANGGLDVVVGASDKNLYVFSAAGAAKIGWPRLLDGTLSGSPTLADPDDDGRMEIIVASESRRLRAIDMGPGSWNPALAPWPTMHRDAHRRGSVTNLLVDVVPGAPGVRDASLAFAASPNPASSTMRLTLRRGAGAIATAGDGVRIYSVTGRAVRALELPAGDGVAATVAWDGRDDEGRVVPAGLYFARASWGGAEATGRLVRLP